jgi:hypothetical protein
LIAGNTSPAVSRLLGATGSNAATFDQENSSSRVLSIRMEVAIASFPSSGTPSA